ncbi:hypothetical protein I6A84_00505 [Frankia sp. CNm7]|uniref:Uncharacterized protein n=1 Tax=Frankia nepalensis TaxID=1836974 RepID=A0A937UL13_9ACTN|nr:hypothetical protein [Frankia nepalensis]MBL7496635.1 hypothetical protein [Frankia nepalensis]MBL7511893.1 hypothetical protein [Frankia nepalensis]MBL7516644.1 hypothetical protein [Frankia nepalensis]MBL7627374.1 hypothetical protein [Frankia nepalensis]
MLWLHQVHHLRPATRDRFAQVVQERWLPEVATRPDTRLAWFATSTRGAVHADEAVTITGVADGAALAELGARVHSGDLTDLAAELSSLRDGVQTRILEPLDYDPFAVTSVTEIPAQPGTGPSRSYMHDFVPPTFGNMRAYEDMMRERYMALTEQDLSGVALRASWRTVPGGGPVPEMFNLSEIRSTAALERLVTEEIPREYKAMGTWMWTALATRDRWTTRLLRSAPWSPLQ